MAASKKRRISTRTFLERLHKGLLAHQSVNEAYLGIAMVQLWGPK